MYEEKLEEEKSVVLRDTREVLVKSVTEINIKSERGDKPILEVNPVSIVPTFRPVLQEIIDPSKRDEITFNNGSPMSLDKSIITSTSEKKDIRLKREVSKIFKNNFYDVDEYRADINNYLRKAEVNIINYYYKLIFFNINTLIYYNIFGFFF